MTHHTFALSNKQAVVVLGLMAACLAVVVGGAAWFIAGLL